MENVLSKESEVDEGIKELARRLAAATVSYFARLSLSYTYDKDFRDKEINKGWIDLAEFVIAFLKRN